MSDYGGYQPGNNNSGWGNDYSNNVDNCEISVWDPSSVNKPKSTSYNSNVTNTPSSNVSVASTQSSPWHESIPTNPTPLGLNNAYNISNTPPLQQAGRQSPYSINSDIYYSPSGDGGKYQTTTPDYNQQMEQKYYEQTQKINQSTPYNQGNSYGQFQNSSYYKNSGSEKSSYSSSTNYRQSYNQDQYNISNASSQSGNSDSFYNQRIANRQYQPSNPTVNPSYVPASNDSITHWSNFTNPLGENEPSAAVIVERIKQTPEERQMAADALRKPTSISKAALAMLGNDLQNASSHLQSVDALEKFKNLQLGIHQENTTFDTAQPRSNLSVTAAEFVPSSASSQIATIAPTQTDDETKNYVLELVTQQINNLIYDPASFDSIISPFVLELRSSNLSQDVVSLIVDQIYEACVLEPNFRYLGSQVCDSLSRKKTGLPKFRSMLLTKAQKEFKAMPEALTGNEEAMERARGFTLFVAELYLSLFNEGKDGTLTRFFVLGRAMLDVVKNLIEHPLDENVQCAVRVIKLTALCLEDTLKDDGKGSIEKFETILDDIEKLVVESNAADLKKSTESLIKGLVNLRGNNWGRTTVKETFPTEAPIIQPYIPGSSPHQIMDENYFMNEPVFFTPDGVQYTSADAAVPEFYDRHLSKYQQPYETLHAGQDQNYEENSNPFSDFKEELEYPEDQSHSDWSESPRETSESPEDYDDEFEQFLKNLDEE